MTAHLISDLHLDPRRPGLRDIFLRYLRDQAPNAQRLFILGDLFEFWAGDDVGCAAYSTELSALSQLAASGVEIRFIAGNRDFLCGRRFAQQAGLRALTEPFIWPLPDGRRAVLMHGDTLCTDDADYQRFRRVVRNRAVQAAFLALPRRLRGRIAQGLRDRASRAGGPKNSMIMDVNESTVAQTFSRHRVDVLIHGHTHKPATHHYANGLERWVLADWSEDRGEVLRVDAQGLHRLALA